MSSQRRMNAKLLLVEDHRPLAPKRVGLFLNTGFTLDYADGLTALPWEPLMPMSADSGCHVAGSDGSDLQTTA